MTRTVPIARAVILLMREPCTAERIASRVCVSVNAVRDWLAHLEAAGMVRRHEVKSEPGKRGCKPTWWSWCNE